MPIERRSSTGQLKVVVVAVATLVLVASIVYGLIQLASGGKGVTFRLGDDQFRAGQAEALARQAAEAPILLSDVSGRGQRRPIVLIHRGEDPRAGWTAFEARPPGAPQDCILQIDRDTNQLVFPEADRQRCGDRSYAPDGVGFRTYPWRVDTDGVLIVDLRPQNGSTTTTAPQ